MSHGHAPSSSVPRLSRSSLVGRERELSAASAALDAGHRLVSFVGGPGIGKTRVMERLAHDLRGRRPVLWVDLADVRDTDEMVAAVATSVGASLAAAGANEAPHLVAQALARTPVVLCLDNLEQLLGSTATAAGSRSATDVLAGWLDVSATTLLCTSRMRLRLLGEHTIDVGPLSAASAIALFEERALAARGRADDARAIGLEAMERVVRRLGMNPLAIEIAAARVAVLGVDGLLARLDDGVGVLAGDACDRAPRQASVAAAFEWSWVLLSDAERSALVQLSCFRGGFSLDAAERVISVAGRAALDLIEALRDRSLLEVERNERGLRFSLSPLVRDLVNEKAEQTVLARARDRHSKAFALAPQHDEADVLNLEAALEHATEAPLVARLALALVPHLQRRGSRDRHERILGRGITAARTADLTDLEFELLQTRAALASAAGEVRHALACQRRALEIATSRGDPESRSFCLARLGWDLFELGDCDEGLLNIKEAVAVAHKAGSVGREAYARNRVGHALMANGNTSEGLDELGRAATLASETQDRWLRQKTLVELVAAQRRLGLVEGAARRLVELEAIGADRDDAIGAMALRERGGLLRAQGHLEDADEALDEATACADAIAAPRLGAEIRTLRARVALDRGDVARGLQLADEALALAVRVDAATYRAAALAVLASARAMSGDAAAAVAALDRVDAWLVPGGTARDAITRARALCERALIAAAERDLHDDDDGTKSTRLAAEALAVARPLGGTPHAIALALSSAIGDEGPEEKGGAADRLLARAADEEARAVLLAARGAHGQRFAVARRIEKLRTGRCARELLVAADGRFYEVDGRRTSLQRQRCLRLIFLALVEHAERAPGLGLTQAEVLARGWPGEKMRSDSGATRVYTSIRRLRKSGLLGLLVTRDDGYLLDPTVAIRRVTARA